MSLPFTLVAAIALTGAHAAGPPVGDGAQMAQLRFLEGTWRGTAPDGTVFYDRYVFDGPATLRSERIPDPDSTTPMDGSTVAVEDGEIVSRWGDFAWRATEIRDGHVAFEPLGDTPNRFSWTRAGEDRVEVTQQWTDAEGAAQRFVIVLERIR